MSAGALVGDGLTMMRPTWFGPEGSPLFGWLHLPADQRVRGFVVLCPPIGLELLITYRTLRILADRLAAAGVGALRFSYATTGDSAGDSADPDRVARWLSSVADAVAYARSTGATSVVGVGLRLGATLAASASRTCAFDGLVLWDPCESGASFLKEERALFRLGVPARERASDLQGGIEGPGAVYDAETVAELGRVRIEDLLDVQGDEGVGTAHPGAGPVLVVTRTESRAREGVRRVASAAGVESREAPGQPGLFDWHGMTVPVDTLEQIVSWTSRLLPDERVEVTPQSRAAAVVATTEDGRAIRERVVELGESRLFGIMTEVDGAGQTAMVLTNAAPPACHLGPARLWVELARTWAPRLGGVLRFDESGNGDSPGGDSDATLPYTPAAVRDVVAAVQTARAGGAREISLTGLCAGAWACLLAGDRVQVEEVNALNPGMWDVRPPSRTPAPGRASGPEGRRAPVAMARHWARLAVRHLLPEALWWRLGRRGYIEAPAGLITPLLRRGTRVGLLFGHREAAAFRQRRGERLVARYGAGGLLLTHEGAEIDHALLSVEAREAVVDRLAAWVGAERTQYSAPPPGSRVGGAA